MNVWRGRMPFSIRPSGLGCILATAILLTACAPDGHVDLEDRLIDQATEAGVGGTVDLATIFPAEVDRVVVVSGYMDQSVVDEALGFSWDASDTGFLYNDGTLIIGARGDSVVGWDFVSDDIEIVLSPDAVSGVILAGSSTVVRALAPRLELCPSPCVEEPDDP